MSQLTILRQYAQKRDPTTLPASVLFSHTDRTLTIFDAFPKSLFHFLVLPRATPGGPRLSELASLRALLRADKARAKETLLALRAEGVRVRGAVEAEMRARYGCVWDVWMGFHAVPSMEHLHLHVLSADLVSDRLKHKRHYNSFRPRLGFFLPLDDVLAWFDATPSHFDTMSELKKSQYEPLLKTELVCFHCERPMKNMPVLKVHLQEEWDALRKRGKQAAAREQHSESHKRKREADPADEHRETDSGTEGQDDADAPHAKRAAVEP